MPYQVPQLRYLLDGLPHGRKLVPNLAKSLRSFTDLPKQQDSFCFVRDIVKTVKLLSPELSVPPAFPGRKASYTIDGSRPSVCTEIPFEMSWVVP